MSSYVISQTRGRLSAQKSYLFKMKTLHEVREVVVRSVHSPIHLRAKCVDDGVAPSDGEVEFLISLVLSR